MFKRAAAARPKSLSIGQPESSMAAAAAAASSRTFRASCPACHSGTRSHSIHSTAGPGLAMPRGDKYARTEFYSSGQPKEELARARLPLDRYREKRDAQRPATVQLDGLIPTTLPSLLEVYQYMTSKQNKPSKNAYYSLMEAAAEYSQVRKGEDVPLLRAALGPETAASSSLQAGLRRGLAGDSIDPGLRLDGHEGTGLGWKIAWSAWADARAGGIDLGARGFELLLQASKPHTHLLPSLLYHVQNNPTLYRSITNITYDFLLRSAIDKRRFESVLVLLTEMRMRGLSPLPGGNRMAQVVEMCCENGAARLALDLAERGEVVEQGGVGLGTWVDILRVSAEGQFMQGIETAWERLSDNPQFVPDEGLCILILNTAARHGNPTLATSVLAKFSEIGIEAREYHYAPVLEAFCSTGDLPEALQVLDAMRTHGGVSPTLATAQPLIDSIVERRDIRWVDAGFDALEALHVKGQRIDVAAFNAVLKAAEEYGDLKRAVVIYRQAGSFGVQPDIETFNTLLSACVKAGAKEQGELVLRDMETALGAGSKDADTFQHLIDLYLSHHEFEPAFNYLEEMKEARHRPPLAVYENLVKACWEQSDERFRDVIDEMQLGGYKPSEKLVAYLNGSPAKRSGGYSRAESSSLSHEGGRRTDGRRQEPARSQNTNKRSDRRSSSRSA
ncbi:hypothetical protein QFC21_000154 [Naganishia friedmannii]|uniref:Uncharacterized protein n=1 Tax=Naganishia friedmannii TaxID=89922 RepID=A0ACC2WAQ3_9TREE|nr:hypothetical protein QFC21_000154 [Naganishia friedmannii]